MKLNVIDVDEYRQYRQWQVLQKIVLPAAAGFGVAAFLLDAPDEEKMRLLSEVVASVLGVLFVYAWWVTRSLGAHMCRELPPSLQSLLLFSSEVSQEFPREEEPPVERSVGGKSA